MHDYSSEAVFEWKIKVSGWIKEDILGVSVSELGRLVSTAGEYSYCMQTRPDEIARLISIEDIIGLDNKASEIRRLIEHDIPDFLPGIMSGVGYVSSLAEYYYKKRFLIGEAQPEIPRPCYDPEASQRIHKKKNDMMFIYFAFMKFDGFLKKHMEPPDSSLVTMAGKMIIELDEFMQDASDFAYQLSSYMKPGLLDLRDRCIAYRARIYGWVGN